jgi:hypothetical protein
LRQERVRHSLLAVKGVNPNSTRAHTRGSAVCHPFHDNILSIAHRVPAVAKRLSAGYGMKTLGGAMSIFIVLMLFATGFLSGVVNAIAGGGTFLTFGAMTLAGLPPIVANATSAIVQFPGYITSVIAYGPEIRAHWREAILLSAVSVVGGLAGSLLLLSLDNPSSASWFHGCFSPPPPFSPLARGCVRRSMRSGLPAIFRASSFRGSPPSMAVFSVPAWVS